MRCADTMAGSQGCRIFVREEGVLWTADAQRKRKHWPFAEAGLAGYVLQGGHSLSLDKNAHIHPQYVADVDWGQASEPSSLLCAPLRGTSGDLLGVLSAGRLKEGGFSIEVRTLLEPSPHLSSSPCSNPRPIPPPLLHKTLFSHP